MPRIPRRWKGGDAAASPVEPDPVPGPPTTTSGDPLAAGGPSGGDQATTALDPLAVAGDPLAGAPPGGAVSAAEAPPADGTVVTSQGATAVSDQPTTVVPAVAQDEGVVVEQAPADASPRFRERTRMRRRLRYLRRLRELAFRDLGGLVFDLHRFGRERGDLVTQKLDALARIDLELRTLEGALRDRRDFAELREPGVAACPGCQTLHDPDANFCPGCGTSLRGAVGPDAAPVPGAVAGEPQPQLQPAEAQPTTTST